MSNPDYRALLAQPKHPSDGGLTVSLRMDLSSECLKRLCDGLAAAVKPNGGYREITTDDDIASESAGDQQVGVTRWLPEHGCDSLENTLDAIKGRLLVAVRNWLPTAVAATTTIKPVPVTERPEPDGVGLITDGRPMNQSYWLALLRHDAYAASFQSVDQYRSALIERASSPRAQPEPVVSEVRASVVELQVGVEFLDNEGLVVIASYLRRAIALLQRLSTSTNQEESE
jgi:hypothetical protein